jgi:hypothetical protein
MIAVGKKETRGICARFLDGKVERRGWKKGNSKRLGVRPRVKIRS